VQQQGNNAGPPTAEQILSDLKTNLAAAQALFPSQGGGSNLSATEQATLNQLNVQGQATLKVMEDAMKKGDRLLDLGTKCVEDETHQRRMASDPEYRKRYNETAASKYEVLGEQVLRESGEYQDEESGEYDDDFSDADEEG